MKRLLLILIVIISIVSIAKLSSSGCLSSHEEIVIDEIQLLTPSYASSESHILITITPTDKTIPNQHYLVSLSYKQKLIGQYDIYWENFTPYFVPGLYNNVVYENYKRIITFTIPKTHEIYTTYLSQYNKPVSQRNFDLKSYGIRVAIDKTSPFLTP